MRDVVELLRLCTVRWPPLQRCSHHIALFEERKLLLTLFVCAQAPTFVLSEEDMDVPVETLVELIASLLPAALK